MQTNLGNNFDMKQYRKTTLVKFGKELKEKDIGPTGPLCIPNMFNIGNRYD